MDHSEPSPIFHVLWCDRDLVPVTLIDAATAKCPRLRCRTREQAAIASMKSY